MNQHRLTEHEATVIVEVCEGLDPQCAVYLYGSRTNIDSKGGDIDLLVVSEVLGFSEKIDILVAIKDQLGDQKIDLAIRSKSRLAADVFFSEVEKVKLN